MSNNTTTTPSDNTSFASKIATYVPYKEICYTAVTIGVFKLFLHAPPMNNPLDDDRIGVAVLSIAGMVISGNHDLNALSILSIPLTAIVTDHAINKIFNL